MINGLTTAAAGMLEDERYQQLLANNLANLSTPGFKASTGAAAEFPVHLMEEMNYGQNGGGQVIGNMGTGVVFQEGVPMFIQGQLTQTNRNLDVALVDNTPPGTYVAMPGPNGQSVSMLGAPVAGAGGRLSVNGQPIAVVNSQGAVMPNVYAVKNPKYQGHLLYAADGRPNYDGNGQPSYLFESGAGQVVAIPGQVGSEGMSLRIGNQNDMGNHAFFAVAYQSIQGLSGIALTRDGHFEVNGQHVLTDASGHAILPIGQNGLPIPGATIVLNQNYQGTGLFASNGDPLVDAKGNPSYQVMGANGQLIVGAKLGPVNADVTQLSPLGQTEFQVGGSFAPAQVLPALQPSTAALKPGELEQSNVNATQTMVQMMQIVNQYQANQTVIQTEDSTLGLAVSDVGKVS